MLDFSGVKFRASAVVARGKSLSTARRLITWTKLKLTKSKRNIENKENNNGLPAKETVVLKRFLTVI